MIKNHINFIFLKNCRNLFKISEIFYGNDKQKFSNKN